MCLASRDEDLPAALAIADALQPLGFGIWHWPQDSGLLPASVYLRHCLLAVQKAEGPAYTLFLHDTYLADRTTTLAQYLDQHETDVMQSLPPPELATRFGG